MVINKYKFCKRRLSRKTKVFNKICETVLKTIDINVQFYKSLEKIFSMFFFIFLFWLFYFSAKIKFFSIKNFIIEKSSSYSIFHLLLLKQKLSQILINIITHKNTEITSVA